MIQIAVCEDDPVLLEQLAGWVRQILDERCIKYNLEVFSNGGALLLREAFDILLLDIAMKPLDGLTLARKLRSRGDESRLVFITAHRQYAIDAFDVQASHYLLKPVNREKLEKLLVRLCDSVQEERPYTIAVRQGASLRRIPLAQILYLEVLDRKIHLHTVKEEIPFYGKLDELAMELPETFFRCHRSYMVNLQHVQCYDRGEVELDTGEKILLSKRRHKAFGLAFLHYLKKNGDVL